MKNHKVHMVIVLAFAIIISTVSCNQTASIPTKTPVPTIQAGDSERSLIVNEMMRSYLLHIPPGLESEQPVPVVFVFHGNPGDANGMRWIGFDEISDLEHFIVIYPEGVEQSWNTGAKGPGSAIAQNVDESAFIKKILSDLEKIVKFDPKRIHAIGYSQGGSLVYRLACNMSDTFAAIASISGSMEYSPCNPSQAVSVIHVHGLEDRKVPFSGGGPWELSPIEKGINTWVNLDNCTDSAKEEDYSNGITHVSYTSCQSGTSVELYTIDSGDHTWPSKDEISTSEVIWDFFASHPKP